MHLRGFLRIGCTVGGSRSPMNGRGMLGPVRSITTKQPTKATAAATKPDLYDDEEFENKLSGSEEDEKKTESHSGPASVSHPKREKWQATSVKKWVKVEDELPVHTCETKEEFYERKRLTYFQYAPDAEEGITLPACEKPTVLHLFTRGKGLNLENVQFFRNILKFDVDAVKEFLREKQLHNDSEDQKFRYERSVAVGPELAAAHFMVFRGGRVRFHGSADWVKKDEYDEYDLPGTHVDGYVVKDIDASGTELLYEGLENFRECEHLESLNLSHCKYADNFFLDRICLQHAHTLKRLDISYCPNISVGGLTALYRLKKLEHLNVTGLCFPYLALACLTLEDEIPGLEIEGVSYILEELDMLPDHEVELVNSRLADVSNVSDVKRIT